MGMGDFQTVIYLKWTTTIKEMYLIVYHTAQYISIYTSDFNSRNSEKMENQLEQV